MFPLGSERANRNIMAYDYASACVVRRDVIGYGGAKWQRDTGSRVWT